MPPSPQSLNPTIIRQLLILQMMQEMNQQRNQQQGSRGPSASSIARLFGSSSAGGATGTAMAGGSAATSVIPAGTAIPAGYTAVGTSATGGTMIAPTASLGAGATGGGAAAGGATTGAGASIGAYALPVAAVAAAVNNAWETGMKDILRGRGDRADWANQGANAIFGAAPNIGLRLLGKRSIGSMMKSGKSGAQRLRDDFRGDLKQAGLIDDNYMITLPDGSKYNIGLDGGARLKNVGKNIDDKTERQTWDVDWSNPLSKFTTDRIDPVIRQIYGQDDPGKKFYPGQFTGMLVNAAMSNANNEQDIEKNINSILSKLQGTGDQATQASQTPAAPSRAAAGQVARVSPGMYVNDRGQVSRAMTSGQAMKQNYGNRIPKRGKR